MNGPQEGLEALRIHLPASHDAATSALTANSNAANISSLKSLKPPFSAA